LGILTGLLEQVTFKRSKGELMIRQLVIILTAALVFTAAPKRADAIVGLATGNAALAIAGGITMGAGLLSPVLGAGLGCVVGGVMKKGCDVGAVTGVYSGTWAAPVVFLIGVVLLPAEAAYPDIAYPPLSRADFDTLEAEVGLTEQEFVAYNNETEEIEAVAASIAHEMARRKDASVVLASQLWKDASVALSADAFSAVTKISAFTIIRVQKARR
jgi:hypothetical protein